MIRLISKIRIILVDKNGESLVESIASLMVFSILMITVTMMIFISLRITNDSIDKATKNQNKVNKDVLERYDNEISTDLILKDMGDNIDVSIPIKLSVSHQNSDAFSAFYPD